MNRERYSALWLMSLAIFNGKDTTAGSVLFALACVIFIMDFAFSLKVSKEGD